MFIDGAERHLHVRGIKDGNHAQLPVAEIKMQCFNPLICW
jgi:hypothetical protein